LIITDSNSQTKIVNSVASRKTPGASSSVALWRRSSSRS